MSSRAFHRHLCWEDVAEVVACGKGGLQVCEGAGKDAFEEGLAVHADDDGFVEVDHLVVEVEGQLSVVTLRDGDSVAFEGKTDGLASLELIGRGCEPIEMRMSDFLLSPDDVSGVRIALVLLQPRQGGGIFEVHPMGFAFDDVSFMDVAIGVGGMEGIEFYASLGALTIAVVGGIEGATPHHEGGVAKVEEGNITGMSCHHRGSCPRVCHAGNHSPHAVTPCGVADEIDFVGVDIEVSDAHLDECSIEGIEVGLEPHVPVVVRSTGCEIDAVLGFVKLFLILPLAVVELSRGVAAAMQGDEEAVAIGRLGAVGGVPERHDLTVKGDFLGLPSLGVLVSDVVSPLGSQPFRLLRCLCSGEVLGGEEEGKEGEEGEEEREHVSHTYSSIPVVLPLMVSSMPLGLIWMSSRLRRSPTACLNTFLLTPNMA